MFQEDTPGVVARVMSKLQHAEILADPREGVPRHA